MLVACRLAGLSALEGRYAGVNALAQFEPTPGLLRASGQGQNLPLPNSSGFWPRRAVPGGASRIKGFGCRKPAKAVSEGSVSVLAFRGRSSAKTAVSGPAADSSTSAARAARVLGQERAVCLGAAGRQRARRPATT